MSAPSPTDALVGKVLDGSAPLTLRAAAARGALPVGRAVLARLYLHLRNDPDDTVRSEAESNLAGLDGGAIREILSDPACHAEVLRHFAAAAARNEGLAEIVAFHPEVPDDALSVLAAEGNSAVIELVLTNQTRLLGSAGLLDRLTANPALRPDQRGRILDLLAHFFKDQETAGAAAPGGSTGIDEVDATEAARLLQVDVGELFAASEILDGDEFEKADDPVVRSVYHKILKLMTAQKAMLAMKGGREERTILIRDTNKVVALSVLKNPRLTEMEVERIAAMRNVSDEVLRAIGAGREWSRNYGVVSALVKNPRTPPGISTNFIPRLTVRDLKWLAADKNVPEIVRRNAKRNYEMRIQQQDQKLRK
ncbi:MAG: hypothetical protein LAO51_17310 [Acidobacteriia bacterium]|nr:hypothetical protein [Terriglobia bacterium]